MNDIVYVGQCAHDALLVTVEMVHLSFCRCVLLLATGMWGRGVLRV